MVRVVCILALGLFSMAAFASSGYPVQSFSPGDYKAGIQNIDFAQNRDMTLFVANNLGVLSYNGTGWEVHSLRQGKKQRSLAFDENTNRLYVGSQGTFGYVEDDWRYVALEDSLPPAFRDFDEVWDVFVLDSNIYFCTFQQIFVYDGKTVQPVETSLRFNRSFLANGKLFTQTDKGRLLEVRGRTIADAYPQNLSNRIISGVVPFEQGYLLFYNSGEIEHTSSFGAKPAFGQLADALRGKYVNHVLKLSDTRLAIATQTAGIFLFDLRNQTFEIITKEDGLLTNACLRTFQDYSGNLWVGMQNGIAVVDINSPMRFVNKAIDLHGSGYEAFEAEEGTYFTTSNGIYFLPRSGSSCTFLKGTEGPAYGIQRIAGKLYAGHHTGLFLLERGKARRVAETDGMWQVKQLASQPQYAIGGTYSGLFLFRIGPKMELIPSGKIAGFEESSRFFEEDRQGHLWVGQFYKGLYRLTLSEDLKSARAEEVSASYPPPLDEQLILSKIDNDLYLSTRAGIFKIDPQSGKIAEAEIFAGEIGEQIVYLLAQDREQNIHVYAENSIGFYKQISPNNYAFIPSSLYQLRYSFNNDLLYVSVNTRQGVMFNANEGFIHYLPELESHVGKDRPLLISRVVYVTEGKELYARKPFSALPDSIGLIAVPARARVLRFDVEYFQFNSFSDKQFRYFLKGFDEDFGEWTNAPSKEYTNLTEGDYELLVQTRNSLGEIVTSKPVAIQVEPPFHRSLFARVLYVLLAAAVLLLISARLQRKYSLKARAAEEARRQELEKKDRELKEIERQRLQAMKEMEEEKIKSELRHLNNLLAASTMNLVVKNEFIETIREKLNEVNKNGSTRDTRKALQQLVKEIDTTLRLQEDWEQFEYHFDQVHGDFLSRLRAEFPDLTPNEQKLCAFLRLNLNTKDIANLMGISLRGVEVARYRLRKKLRLEQGENLSKFILEY
ncbi:MAG: hypothetical protein CMN32_12315 [Saprospirales bacterium]|nr:hypothetical protein [Saprospirales bacterium]